MGIWKIRILGCYPFLFFLKGERFTLANRCNSVGFTCVENFPLWESLYVKFCPTDRPIIFGAQKKSYY